MRDLVEGIEDSDFGLEGRLLLNVVDLDAVEANRSYSFAGTDVFDAE